MKTKILIKLAGLKLFNEYGVQNITLRHIAKNIGKSYGNVTYHFKTKKDLILSLYEDLVEELYILMKEMPCNKEDLFKTILSPSRSFQLSIKYLFFYKDFVEIKRFYPELSSTMEQNNRDRMKSYLNVLKILKQDEILNPELEDDDLMYLMKLSGIVRTFFFIQNEYAVLNKKNTEKDYIKELNRLLTPYLTTKGKNLYYEFID